MPDLMTMSDIARLAGVRRPVVSMWRDRFRTTPMPFPAPHGSSRALRFDRAEVAEWLTSTGRGNNAEAADDSPAHALDEQLPDAAAVENVSALIALRAHLGEALGGKSVDELLRSAEEVDGSDELLRFEVERLALDPDSTRKLMDFADRIADAAFGNAQALERVLEFAHRRAQAPGHFTDGAVAWFARLARELVVASSGSDSPVHLSAGDAAAARVALESASLLPEHVPVALGLGGSTSGSELRQLRRLASARGLELGAAGSTARVVHIRVISEPSWESLASVFADTPADGLSLVVGPAALLVDDLRGAARNAERAQLLRSGRVRAVASLPAGLLADAPRRRLGLWLVASPQPGDPAARWTSTADRSAVPVRFEQDAALSSALLDDLVAVTGSSPQVNARAFRFLKVEPLAAVLARRGSLVGALEPVRHASQSSPVRPERVAEWLTELGAVREALSEVRLPDPVLTRELVASPSPERLEPSRVGALARDGHVRALAGTRLAVRVRRGNTSGTTVVGSPELLAESRVGERRVDLVEFALAHPRARLTEPGDVVFLARPRPVAWVDRDGASVVEAPARILRINAADSAGLVAGVLAAAINAQPAGASDWRDWFVRRARPAQQRQLADALDTAADARATLRAALDRVDRWERLVTDAVTSGAATFETTTASDPSFDDLMTRTEQEEG